MFQSSLFSFVLFFFFWIFPFPSPPALVPSVLVSLSSPLHSRLFPPPIVSEYSFISSSLSHMSNEGSERRTQQRPAAFVIFTLSPPFPLSISYFFLSFPLFFTSSSSSPLRLLIFLSLSLSPLPPRFLLHLNLTPRIHLAVDFYLFRSICVAQPVIYMKSNKHIHTITTHE